VKHHAAGRDNPARSRPEDEKTRKLLTEYVRAWDEADIARLTALLKDDAMWIMPPLPTWYHGREAILAFATRVHGAQRLGVRSHYAPTRANGQPAMAVYHWSEAKKAYRAFGLHVLKVDESVWQIAEVINFLRPELFPRFGLAPELSG
jgi:RNA polymerase sigma-70 factor (ECF subfamily)